MGNRSKAGVVRLSGGLVLAFLGLAGLTGCLTPASRPAAGPTPPEVVDRFVFEALTPDLRPIPNLQVSLQVESGESLTPLTLVTDSAGQAEARIKAQVLRTAATKAGADVVVTFRSALAYRVEGGGWLALSGRAEINDVLESFARPQFAQLLDVQPRPKLRTIRLTLVKLADLFEPGALEQPLARTVAAGLPDLWRTWAASGRLAEFKPVPGSWSIRPGQAGPYLKLGLEQVGGVGDLSDVGLYQVFSQRLVPLLDDLAVAFGPLVAGWDLTLKLGLKSDSDPHAMPTATQEFHLVVAEVKRLETLIRPGGSNWLIFAAETCAFKGQAWNPLPGLESEEQRFALLWEFLSAFMAPGPGTVPNPAEQVKDTSAEPLPAGPARH